MQDLSRRTLLCWKPLDISKLNIGWLITGYWKHHISSPITMVFKKFGYLSTAVIMSLQCCTLSSFLVFGELRHKKNKETGNL